MKELKPALVEQAKSFFSPSRQMMSATTTASEKCMNLEGCPIYSKSFLASEPNLSIVSKIPSNTSILILNGENDTQTPVQGAFLLQQKLTEINHRDHVLITYPNLGHVFYPSSQWQTQQGPIPQYVLADLYSWLESFLPEVIQPSGALYSSANDLLKYLSANMGLIHTKINDILQDMHLIRHERLTIVNSSTTTQSLVVAYTGLAWNIGTNLGTEVIWHNGALDGYVSLLAFNPVKQIGLVILCSCDERDAVPPAVYVVPSLLNPSSIFTPGKVASTINANASVVAPGNVK